MAKKGAAKNGKVTKGKTSTAKRKTSRTYKISTRLQELKSRQPATTSTDWDDVGMNWDIDI